MRRSLGCSLAAVVVGLLICVHQRHFVVSLANPMSFVRMLRHQVWGGDGRGGGLGRGRKSW